MKQPNEQPNIDLQNIHALYDQESFKTALKECKQFCDKYPDNDQGWLMFAMLHKKLGNFEAELNCLDQAAIIDQNNFKPLQRAGEIHQTLGQREKAKSYYLEVLKINSDLVSTQYNLSVIYLEEKNIQAAISCLHYIVKIDSTYWKAQANLGYIYREQGRYKKSISSYKSALNFAPNNPQLQFNMGVSYLMISRFNEAIDCFLMALSFDKNMAEAYSNLGVARAGVGLFSQALKDTNYAVSIRPNNVKFLRNLGSVLVKQNNLKEASVVYERALEIDPSSGDTHFEYSWLLLLAGKLRRGWVEYEWREYSQGRQPRELHKPRWDGSLLDGKTILLYSEQGYGDTIQFLRFVPQVREMGGAIILECQKRLMPLAKGVKGVDVIVEQGKKLPEYDVEAPLLSLAKILNIDLDMISKNTPYIDAPSQIPKNLKVLFDCHKSDIKVGIVWSGNPANQRDLIRSCPLSEFSSLTKIDGVKLFSLQIEMEDDVKLPNSIVDLAGYLQDFSDTAALVKNLDLVITVDTAVAHLAGALGCPVWTLVCAPPDWRWMLDRLDTPWYPTMRLFRQGSPFDWKPVLDDVFHELEQLVCKRSN